VILVVGKKRNRRISKDEHQDQCGDQQQRDAVRRQLDAGAGS